MSHDFSPVSEGYHGIYHLAHDVAARRGHTRPAGSAVRSEDQVVSEEAKFREVKLDRATADLLEALARARGLTLAQLLAEYAAADSSMPGRADIKTGTR